MKFWDASAIVPLVAHELRSEELKQLAASDPAMLVWQFAPIEVMSAVWRKYREHTDDLARRGSERRLLELERRWRAVEDASRVRTTARRLLSTHRRAADALQLGAP